MRKEAADIRKLKKYKPTRFMAEGSAYNRELANLAVSFIGCLKHTKGEWYGQNFEPVSYTHLDVYKRQLYGCMGDFCAGADRWPAAGSCGAALAVY